MWYRKHHRNVEIPQPICLNYDSHAPDNVITLRLRLQHGYVIAPRALCSIDSVQARFLRNSVRQFLGRLPFDIFLTLRRKMVAKRCSPSLFMYTSNRHEPKISHTAAE